MSSQVREKRDRVYYSANTAINMYALAFAKLRSNILIATQ